MTKSLVELGALRRSNGEYVVEGSLQDVRLPDTIQEVILSRIDRLDREARETIQLASVIGREFTRGVLERIGEMEVELDGLLGSLRSLELIYEKDYFPELSYMFKHALTHEVAYSTLLMERRRSLHRTVATAIEELYKDRLEEHYEVLARHFDEGQVWDKALEYLVKSALKAAAFAAKDALRFFDRALLAADRLPAFPLEVVTQIHQGRATVQIATSDMAGAVGAFRELKRIRREAGDRQAEGKMTALQAFAHVLNHEFDKAESVQAEANAIADEIEDEGVKAWAMMPSAMLALTTGRLSEVADLTNHIRPHANGLHPLLAGFFHMMVPFVESLQSQHDLAAEHMAGFVEMAGIRGATGPEMLGRTFSRITLGRTGRYSPALLVLDEAIARSDRLVESGYKARCMNTQGWIHNELQDWERGLELNRRSVELARGLVGLDTAEVEMNARANAGDSLLGMGRLKEALEELEELHQTAPQQHEWMRWRYSMHIAHSLGEAVLEEGDAERALQLAEECLAAATSAGAPRYIAKGKRLRGQALSALGRHEDSVAELDRGIEVATDDGNPSLIWRALAASGRARAAAGDADGASDANRKSLEVIDSIASDLEDESLRNTFLSSTAVSALREAAKTGN